MTYGILESNHPLFEIYWLRDHLGWASTWKYLFHRAFLCKNYKLIDSLIIFSSHRRSPHNVSLKYSDQSYGIMQENFSITLNVELHVELFSLNFRLDWKIILKITCRPFATRTPKRTFANIITRASNSFQRLDQNVNKLKFMNMKNGKIKMFYPFSELRMLYNFKHRNEGVRRKTVHRNRTHETTVDWSVR